MAVVVEMVVYALVGGLIECCVVPVVEFEFREMPISLYFFGEILVEFLLETAFLVAAMAV